MAIQLKNSIWQLDGLRIVGNGFEKANTPSILRAINDIKENPHAVDQYSNNLTNGISSLIKSIEDLNEIPKPENVEGILVSTVAQAATLGATGAALALLCNKTFPNLGQSGKLIENRTRNGFSNVLKSGPEIVRKNKGKENNLKRIAGDAKWAAATYSTVGMNMSEQNIGSVEVFKDVLANLSAKSFAAAFYETGRELNNRLGPLSLTPDVIAPGMERNTIDNSSSRVLGPSSGWATPIVAGLVAAMLQVNPDLTPEQVKKILQQTQDPNGSVNATKALEEAKKLSSS